MDERTITKGVLRVCCANDQNLVLQPADPARPNLATRKCRVCGRNHYELSVDPAVIGLTGMTL